VVLEKLLEFLNQKIRDLEGREKQIGHSYFMKDKKPLNDIEDLKFVFSNEIIPLLQDYFYEDYEKIYEILGNTFVDKKNMEIRPEWKENSKVFEKAVIDLYT
jgi:5-methylcytosine-specific restriction protein B